MSLSLALAPFEWKASDGETYKVNLIDTPGYADFAGDVDAALAVADLAVLVVSAVDGVEVGTELAWSKCAERRIPRLVFVNKEDKPRADFRAVRRQPEGAVRVRLRAPRAAARRGGEVPRRRRRAHRPGVRVRAGRPAPLRADPGGRRRRGAPPARRAGRGDRRRRRRAARALPLGGGALGVRARAHPRPRGARMRRVPGARRVGHGGDRCRPAGRLHLRARPVPCRPPDAGHRRHGIGGDGGRGDGGPIGQAPRLRLQDRGRPVRRPGLAVQGPVGHGGHRRPPRQHRHRHGRAPARAVPHAGTRAPAHQQGRRRRPRRRRQARRHAHRLDAGAEGLTGARRRRRRRRPRRSGSPSSRSRSPTTTSSRAPSSG